MKHAITKILALILCVSMVLSLAGISVSAANEITLPDLISDNMLIQRDAPIKLWGFGGAEGDTVTAVIEDAKGNKVNEGEGKVAGDGFEMELDAMQAGGPYTIYFKGNDGKNFATVKNVLIGDLFLQGGQSNMQYRIYSVPNFVEEKVTPNPPDDKIRLFYNGDHISSETPAKDLKGEWIIADKNTLEYSAVGYQALEDIYKEIKIPVGGICSPYGGTSVSNFLEGDGIYNAKIAPLTNINFKGIMWYQGGTDSGYTTSDVITERYNKLIRSYREIWKDIPFIIVQLHQSPMKGLKYGSSDEYTIKDYSNAREAQLNAYLTNDNVGMVVAMDLSLQKYKEDGEDPSHPWQKKPIGQRMANVALSMIYGKDIQANSPAYVSHTIEGNAVKITVKDAYDGLKTSDGERPWGFMIAGEDGKYHEARAKLEGNTITLTSSSVPNPVSASYGIEKHIWPYASRTDEAALAEIEESPDFPVNVVNSANLPLAAFNTEALILDNNIVETPSEEQSDAEENKAPVSIDGVETSGDKTILYVALDGNDSNAGTINAPLASIAGARDKIRALKASNALGKGGAVVYVREGNYTMNEGVTFRAEDSGTKDAPIVYRNYPDEEVNFIGGAYLNWEDFKPVKDEKVLSRIVDEDAREHIVSIDLHALGYKNLPEPKLPGTYSYWAELGTLLKEKYGVEKPATNSSELIIDGVGAVLARYPNDGDLLIGEVIKKGDFKQSDDPMEFVVDDPRVKNWTKAENAIISGTFTHSWAGQATFLDSVNTSKNSIRSKYPVWYGAVKDQHFYVFNLIEEIDMPGEYYIDIKDGILYLYAPDGGAEEIVYTLHTGTMFHVSDASYIEIKGFGMKYTRGNFVSFSGKSSNNKLIGCEFTYNTTSGAVAVNGKENSVYDCYFHDCAMAIISDSGDRPTLTRSNNLIENNKFENSERTSKTYSPSLYIQGVGTKAYHNEISEAEHCVIQLGGNFHEVNFNEIYNACMNTDDMGAIYTGRNLTMRGNVFKNNYIHDIGGANRGTNGTHGIFFDDFWESADVVGNVFANITGGGVMFAGSYNVVDNNIFANTGTVNGTSMILTRSYLYGGSFDDTPYVNSVKEMPIHSEVWTTAFPEIVNVIDEKGKLDINNHIVVTNNVLYNSGEPRISDEIKKTLVSGNNITYQKDPGFYDLANENYLLKEDSEVYEDIPGFKPIPFTRMGRYNDRALSRAKEGYVFCLDSPYIFKEGERVKTDKNQAFVENETIYVPLRTASDAVGANLTYDEATDSISIAGSGKLLEFVDGAYDKVSVNGTEYVLSKPLINIEGSNYISVADIVNIFEKYLVRYENLTIITGYDGLFNMDADTNLLRWLEEQITVY
ncbi:MAG: hypothetical protein J6A69_06510 [Clostridia bacterium]|nr:hypothetical protein [Clostridia bacterium]